MVEVIDAITKTILTMTLALWVQSVPTTKIVFKTMEWWTIISNIYNEEKTDKLASRCDTHYRLYLVRVLYCYGACYTLETLVSMTKMISKWHYIKLAKLDKINVFNIVMSQRLQSFCLLAKPQPHITSERRKRNDCGISRGWN